MPEARLSVRVDDDIKKQAEIVFREMGLTLSSGINLYLAQVAKQQTIPLTLAQIPNDKLDDMELNRQLEELKAQMIVEFKIKNMQDHGVPVALYDDERKRPYLMYPDGRQVYDIVE